uniref:Uncharacterized protein n=1 Tax=Panagrolaimus sp. PS1159 TaxID=55785 RepID=A0AC35G816_9BILA
MVFDRAYCTWRPSNYANGERTLAWSYMFCIFILSFILTCAVVIEYPIIPYRSYCHITNESGSDRINVLLRSLLILAVVYSIILIMLLIKNKQNMINNLHGFDVNTHFQMKSNQLAIRFVTASSISSLLISVIFLGSNIFARAIMENIGKVAFHAYLEYTYITPIHGFISASVIIFYAFCRKKQMFTVNSTENLTTDHFFHLQKMWN